MEKPMQLLGGPADGQMVDGAKHGAQWLNVPFLDERGFGYAQYERSGDVFLYVDPDEIRKKL